MTFLIDKLRSYAKGSYSYTLVAQGIILVSGLINSMILAQGLGVSGRGELGIVMLWPTLLTYIGSLGQAEASLFFTSSGEHSTSSVFTTALIYTLILSSIVIPIGYFLMPIVLSAQSDDLVLMSRAFLAFIPLGMLLGHLSNILRAHMKMFHFNFLRMIVPLGSMFIALVLMFTGYLSVEIVMVTYVVLSIFALVYGVLILISGGLLTHIRIEPTLLISVFSYGIKVFLGTIFSLTNLRLDQVLLTSVVSPTQFGLYVVATKLAGISSMIAEVVVMVAIPKIGQFQELSQRLTALISIFRKFWWLAVSFKIVFALAVPIALPLIYGVDFAPAVPICLVLILGSLFWDAKLLLLGGSQIINRPSFGSVSEGIAAVFTVVLLLILVPLLGVMGAAIASLAAYAVSAFYLIWRISRLEGATLRSLFFPTRMFKDRV